MRSRIQRPVSADVKKKRHESDSKHRVSSGDSGESNSVAARVRAGHDVIERPGAAGVEQGSAILKQVVIQQ